MNSTTKMFVVSDLRPLYRTADSSNTCTLRKPRRWPARWRYQARAYRHFGWDNGTLIANLLAACASVRLPARVVCGFIDAEISRLLDLDPKREVAFSMVAVGRETQLRTESKQLHQKLAPLCLQTALPSTRELDYPVMHTMHASSSLHSFEEVQAWRMGLVDPVMPPPLGYTFELRPSRWRETPQESIEQVILRRGSCRRFSRDPVSFESLSTILDRATRGISADFIGLPGAQLNQLYLIVNAVNGLPCGTYVFHRDCQVLELLNRGDYRNHAGHIALHQEQAADAAVDIFLMANLPAVLEQFGNRGYRAVHLEAGVVGGKLYLGAYAQYLSATGLTFFDDAVTQLFSPHAYGMSAIFLLALGKAQKAHANKACANEVAPDAPAIREVRPCILVPGRCPDTDADGSAQIWPEADRPPLHRWDLETDH